MRKYQRIWEQLKENKKAKLIARPDYHARIINAVRKEKCGDLAFKLLSIEAGSLFKLHYTIEGDSITFTLDPEMSSKNL